MEHSTNHPPRLRPMNITDILDAAFKLYRAHFFTFIGITALLYVPVTMLQGSTQLFLGVQLLDDLQNNAERLLSGGPALLELLVPFIMLSILGALLQVIAATLISGALANAISLSYLGQPFSILRAYRFGARRFISLLLFSLLSIVGTIVTLGLFSGGAIAVLSTLGVMPGERPNIALTVFAILAFLFAVLLFVIGAIYLTVHLLLTTQVIVLEGHGVFGGLIRSWRLVKGSFWRVLGSIVLMIVISQFVVGIPSGVLAFALNFVSQDPMVVFRNQIIASLISQLGLIIVMPLMLSVYTLLYYDLRVRKEGFDIELMSQASQSQGGEP